MNRQDLEAYLHQRIPITRSIGVSVCALERGSIRLSAPLEINHNDKGTAFGGSLATMLTLAGWGLLHVELIKAGFDADIVIQKSDFLYNRPVEGDIACYCDLPPIEVWQRFTAGLAKRGKSRVILTSWVAGPSNAAVTMEGRYVAVLRDREGKTA